MDEENEDHEAWMNGPYEEVNEPCDCGNCDECMMISWRDFV